MFARMAGADMQHRAYVGAPRATQAVIDGEADLLFSVMAPTVPKVKAGVLRALAVTGPQRSTALPDVPTLKESGFPDYELTTWQGVLAPAGTPPDVIAQLNRDIAELMRDPQIVQHLQAQGFEPTASTPEEFAARIAREVATPL
jgi:tripartite-type tricarboxylate transporter receptor subunit TctC